MKLPYIKKSKIFFVAPKLDAIIPTYQYISLARIKKTKTHHSLLNSTCIPFEIKLTYFLKNWPTSLVTWTFLIYTEVIIIKQCSISKLKCLPKHKMWNVDLGKYKIVVFEIGGVGIDRSGREEEDACAKICEGYSAQRRL